MDAIVLAGGLGTRLAPLTESIPKPMVEVAGKPFLEYLLASLRQQDIMRVVLAVSYKWEMIQQYFGESFQEMELRYSLEKEPLGTGGGVRQALTQTRSREVLVGNGDTFFQVTIQKMREAHVKAGAQVTLALKPMADCSRYGAVDLRDGRVIGFEEKGRSQSGYVNGGVSIFNRDVFDRFSFPESFSLERDLLAAHLAQLKISGFVSDGYFVDIGVPQDLQRAQDELPNEFVAVECVQSTSPTT